MFFILNFTYSHIFHLLFAFSVVVLVVPPNCRFGLIVYFNLHIILLGLSILSPADGSYIICFLSYIAS